MSKRRTLGCFCLAAVVLLSCLAGCARDAAEAARLSAGLVILPTAETKAAAPTAQPVKVQPVQSAQASTMHLEKVQGTVRVEDIYEKSLPIREGMQLHSGYELATARESLAWMSLDKTKAAKLDVLSSAQVRQHGKNLEINLTEGSLFFDVSRPLAEDESLKIRTATMVMGIRGTSGWVSLLKNQDVQVALLEGSVDVECTNPETGAPITVTVENGQILTLAPPAEAGSVSDGVRLEEMEAEKIPLFAAKEVADSPQLQARIGEKSPVPVESILAVAVQAEQPPAAPSAPVVRPYTPPEPEYEEEFYDEEPPANEAPPVNEEPTVNEEPPANETPPAAPDTSTGTEGDDGTQGDGGLGGVEDDRWIQPPSDLEPYSREWWYWMVDNNWDLMVEYRDNWSEERPENLPEEILWPPTHQPELGQSDEQGQQQEEVQEEAQEEVQDEVQE